MFLIRVNIKIQNAHNGGGATGKGGIVGWLIGTALIVTPFFGVTAVLFTIGTCILGFWISIVRLMYAMGRQNFLPAIFSKVNKHNQPIVPNLVVLGLSLGAIYDEV